MMHANGMKLFRRLLALPSLLSLTLAAEDLTYRFPTDNDKLCTGKPDEFYMYCDRLFEGEKSKPWQAGGYGLVRNPFRASDGSVLFSRIHEGIDIKPLRRDAKGEPLDAVRPVAPGKVAYVNLRPGASNYGRYVVIAHQVPEGVIYTLYAHLASVSCTEGQLVGTGNELGIMGHSGVGLNRERAHCHVEVCLMINSAYDQFCPKDNKHGLFNGLNLAGFDMADLLRACKDGQPLSLTAYFATLQEHYRVRVPCVGVMDLLRRHPFLYKGEKNKRPPSLDIAFTAEGVPIAIYPGKEPVDEPKVISCRPMPTLQQNCTVNRVKNSSRDAALTASGKRYIQQYLWLEGLYPPAPSAPEPPQP